MPKLETYAQRCTTCIGGSHSIASCSADPRLGLVVPFSSMSYTLRTDRYEHTPLAVHIVTSIAVDATFTHLATFHSNLGPAACQMYAYARYQTCVFSLDQRNELHSLRLTYSGSLAIRVCTRGQACLLRLPSSLHTQTSHHARSHPDRCGCSAGRTIAVSIVRCGDQLGRREGVRSGQARQEGLHRGKHSLHLSRLWLPNM